MIIIGNKEEIMEILKSENLTASELSIKMEMTVENVKVYVNRLQKEKLIRSVTKRGREMVWSVNMGEINGNYKESVELLKFLNNFFKDNYKLLVKRKASVEFVMKNEDKFNRIEELSKSV